MAANWVARVTLDTLELVEPGDAHVAERGECRAVFGGDLYDGARRVENAAATIVDAYAREGDQMLPMLRGVFGFVLVDPGRRAAYCVRDPLGIHPLFTAEADGGLLVSPSVKALIRQESVSSAVNELAVAGRLVQRWAGPDETYFNAVRRVPPGHTLELGSTGQRLYRHWDPAPDGESFEWFAPEEVARFDAVFEQAVRRCLPRSRPGVFLSGGLDSVSVAAVAVATGSDLLALSLAFPNPDVSEVHIQRRVASDLGLDQVLMAWADAVGPEGLFHGAAEMSGRLAHPVTNFWAPAYDRLAVEGSTRGCDVVLTGAGGDEWIGVSPFYAADLFRALDLRGIYRLWSSQHRAYPLSTLLFMRNIVWRFGLRPLAFDAAARLTPDLLARRKLSRAADAIPEWLAPDSGLRSRLLERVAQSIRLKLRPHPAHGRRYPRLYFGETQRVLEHPFVAMEMEESFDRGVRLGLRLLAPYWDADLLELLYRTPPDALNAGGRSKGIVRQSLDRRFPGLGFDRQKKVVATRFVTGLMRAEMPRVWASLGGARTLSEAGIVDERGATAFFEHAIGPSSTSEELYLAWELVSCEAWFRYHT